MFGSPDISLNSNFKLAVCDKTITRAGKHSSGFCTGHVWTTDRYTVDSTCPITATEIKQLGPNLSTLSDNLDPTCTERCSANSLGSDLQSTRRKSSLFSHCDVGGIEKQHKVGKARTQYVQSTYAYLSDNSDVSKQRVLPNSNEQTTPNLCSKISRIMPNALQKIVQQFYFFSFCALCCTRSCQEPGRLEVLYPAADLSRRLSDQKTNFHVVSSAGQIYKEDDKYFLGFCV